jgi:hypothetical protein
MERTAGKVGQCDVTTFRVLLVLCKSAAQGGGRAHLSGDGSWSRCSMSLKGRTLE